MPEGPSIVILKEAVSSFIGKTVFLADGNTKAIDLSILENQQIVDFKSWGKHFLICFEYFTIRIHFMLCFSVHTGSMNQNQHQLGFH